MDSKTYRQQDLISQTLELLNSGRPVYSQMQRQELENVIRAYETVIVDCLKEASPEKNILVKCFSGLQLTSSWMPSRKIKLNGRTVESEARIGGRAKFTKYFSRSLNQ
jgi:hypothetical protein